MKAANFQYWSQEGLEMLARSVGTVKSYSFTGLDGTTHLVAVTVLCNTRSALGVGTLLERSPGQDLSEVSCLACLAAIALRAAE